MLSRYAKCSILVIIRQTKAMRFLTIVRHCEAEPGTDDFVRTLTDRGRRQAEEIRSRVLDSEQLTPYGPVTALVSAAARTRETYALGFAGTAFVHALETSELIYNGQRDVTPFEVLEQLAAIDPVRESLLVLGHFPWVWQLVNELTDEMPEALVSDYPVGTAVVLAIPEHEQVGLRHYEVAAVFVPTI
jgi:phosphohistidine phosphatase SixA